MHPWKYWKYLVVLGVSTYTIAVIVACGNKANDVTTTYNCPKGTSYFANGNCYNQFGQVIGNYGTSGVSADTGYLAENFRNNNLQIGDGGAFKNFVQKALGVCGRAHLNYGIYDCDAWTGGFFQVYLQTSASQGNNYKLTFRAFPNQQMGGGLQIHGQLPSLGDFFAGLVGFPVIHGAGMMRNPLELIGTASVISNYQGFEVRTYGAMDTMANRSLIQLQVPSGRLMDAQLAFKLFFEGAPLASGTLLRCLNSSCQ